MLKTPRYKSAPRKFTYARLGSISSATMRPEDLIPVFADELEALAKVNRDQDDLSFIRELRRRMENPGYYDTEDADYDLYEDLFDRLGKYAPPLAYFGSNEGDGADYGFWLPYGFERDFDGLKVSDLSEVPRRYYGEVLLINDHGNASLYEVKHGRFTEIWSVG